MQMLKKANIEDQNQTKFFPGDFAVYPAHGVGKIESIETKEVGGEKQDFYIMNILENKMVIMIPIKNATSVGLRNTVDEKDIQEVYSIMQSRREKPLGKTWNRIHKRYMDKIMSGDLCKVAEVFRDLYLLNIEKGISFEQNKLYDTAKGLLLRELSIVRNTDESVIMAEIESLFKPQ